LNLHKHMVLKIALTAGVISLLVYFRALFSDFVNWDDTDYVLNNEMIRTLDIDMLVKAFTNISIFHWVPLLWISYAVDYHFWGLNPLGYHLTNIILHVVNTGLTVAIADGLFRRHFAGKEPLSAAKYLYPAMLLLAGLLFGIHPAKVESVVWVTERKDVLNGVFILSAIYCYLRYVQQKEEAEGSPRISKAYVFSLILFFLSLMVKPSSAFIPAALLVIDWYPLGRLKKGKIWSLLLEKIPFVAVVAAILVTSVIFKLKGGAFNPLSEFPFWIRVIASGNAIAEYLKIMLYPIGILPYYELPYAIPKVFILKAAAIGCLICFSLYWIKKAPWFPAIILFFTITIFPSLQFFADGAQLVYASRYTYLPSLLPCIVLAALLTTLYQKLTTSAAPAGRILTAGVAIALLVFYGVLTQDLIGVWKNSGTMWSRVIAAKTFDRAYFYRGLYYVDAGKYDAAIADYSKCIEIWTEKKIPDIYNLYAFRGEALIKAGRYAEAVKDFDVALSMFPHRLYYFYRGTALKGVGRIKEAEADFARAGRARGQMYWFPFSSPL
jgi:tetratricopeptide (TPR) repeat protein